MSWKLNCDFNFFFSLGLLKLKKCWTCRSLEVRHLMQNWTHILLNIKWISIDLGGKNPSVLFRIFLSFRSSSTFLKWIVYQMMVTVLASPKELHHQKSWLPSAESTLISRITLRSTWNMLANCLQMTSVIGFWYVFFVFTHSLLHVHISLIQKQYVGEVNPAFIRALANAVLESSMRVNLFW